MPLSYSELEEFYEDLVAKARGQGIVCAITSGMACVNFGVSQTTRDCDLIVFAAFDQRPLPASD